MPLLIAAGLLSAVTMTIVKTNRRKVRRATVQEEKEEPILFI